MDAMKDIGRVHVGLLAEKLIDTEDINPQVPESDVAVVIGANAAGGAPAPLRRSASMGAR